tara:strand:- start:673 stop:912 length:240 start_codon:yes stop_codon:yes gene_type:complete
MDNIPKPTLYRTTNNNTVPNINSSWVGENGYIIKVSGIYTKKKPLIISYKIVEPKTNSINNEYAVSLQRFHSLFRTYDY